MSEPMLYVGLMSGTSADGVDAALVRVDDDVGARFKLLAFETTSYPEKLRQEIHEVCDARTGTVDRVCALDAMLGNQFAQAAIALTEAAGYRPEQIRAIGSHGQTVYHLPDAPATHGLTARSTLQIGNASVIVQHTGIPTVSDFRSRDVAAGGQGAPLVPMLDFLFFRSESHGRVLVNIGGIANVTVLPAGCSEEDVMAFDTGPGNVIMDGLVARLTKESLGYDVDGRMAQAGRVDEALLTLWMGHSFFEQTPPRSTGREMFGDAYVDRLVKQNANKCPEDLLATATAFTAESIHEAVKCYAHDYDRISEIFVSGGGSENPTLMRALETRFAPIAVGVTDELGVRADAKEAIAFAVLAHRSLNGLVGNIPAATGASRAVVLGNITPV